MVVFLLDRKDTPLVDLPNPPMSKELLGSPIARESRKVSQVHIFLDDYSNETGDVP
jgi:hypothetical protein